MRTSIVKSWERQGITLPEFLLESVNLKDGESVDITAENGKIVIKKADIKNTHRTFEERTAGFNGDFVFEEWDTGSPVGEEIW